MNNDRFYFLLTEYLDDHLDDDLVLEIKAEIERRGEDVHDIERLKQLSEAMNNWQIPECSEKLKDNFYTLLADEQQKQLAEQQRNSVLQFIEKFDTKVWLPRMAYAAVFLLIGYIVGLQFTQIDGNYRQQMSAMSQEIQQVREVMMLSLIDNPMAAERLKAVNTSQYIEDPDEKIIHALLTTLNTDPNENVRLAAVDALLQFSGNDEVRKGLIESIPAQNTPMMQIALANGMLAIDETDAVPYFKELLQKQGLNKFAREKIEETVEILS